MSQIAYGTITITDTNDIESIVIEYARNQSSSSAPESGWSTDRPAWAQGYYIWQRTRTHKAGTDASKDTYGTAVCITGSTGATGATGQSLSSTKTQYTNVASNVTITTDNHTSYTWTDNVPAYNSSKPTYWARVTNTYTNPAKTEYLVYKDQGITDAIKTSNDANTIAGQAKTTANEAKEIAQQASADVTNLQTRTKYFWTNLVAKTGYPVGTYAASGIDGVTFDYENSSTYGYNTLYSNGIKLRYNAINLGELTGTALTFYKPSTTSQGKKAMELGATALKFYDATGSNVQAEFGGTKARVSGTIEALDGKIGSSENNYWIIDTFYDANQQESYSSLHSSGDSFIQLGDTNTWTIGTNKISSSWRYMSTSSEGITNPYYFRYKQFALGEDYYDYGIHIPSVLKASGENTNLLADKFLYIRQANYVNDGNLNQLELDSSWTYKFYIDGDGNLYAKNLYFFDENGDPVQVGGADGAYLPKTGGTITGNLEVNGTLTKGSKNVAYLTEAPTNGKILIADGTGGGIKTSGYTIATSVPSNALFTDEKVQTSQANTTKIYLAGTPTIGDNVGTLNYDSNVYLTTTAGTLHATTFDGTTFTGTAAKATNDSDGNKISTTYLKLSGGTVSGEVEFRSAVNVNDELYADSATFGNLIVNGSASFTNNLQANTINGVEVGNSPKFTDTVTTVTVTGTGNAITSASATNGAVTLTKGATFLTSYTETDPVFTASAAHGITSGDISNWNSKTSNTGTVTSIRVQASSPLQSSTSTAQSATLNTTISFINQNANTVLAGPASGSTAAAPTFRTLVAADIPDISGTYYLASNPSGYTTNTGTVTSVKVQGSNGLTGSGTVTTSGTITISHADTSSQASSSNSGRTYIQSVTLDEYGHVTGLSTATETVINTHNTAYLYAGTSSGSANAETTNGNTYLILVDGGGVTTRRKISGSGAATVTSDSSGNIAINTPTSLTGVSFDSGTITFSKSDGTTVPITTSDFVITQASGATALVKLKSGSTDEYEGYAAGGATTKPVYFDSNGHPVAVTSIPYSLLSDAPSSMTPKSHTHGNIQNGGTLQTNDITIANNDQLIVTDSSDGNKIARTSVKFDGSTTTKALTPKGTWETFATSNTNTTYTLTNALASHKFTWTFTAGGSGSGSTTTTAELVAGTGISLTDDTSNKKITIGNSGVTSITTTAGTHTTKSSATGAVSFNVPTKTSHLTNDSGFLTNSTLYESKLNWGNTNLSANVTPIGASLSAEHSANRIAYLNPAAISIEYSTNGGSTWTDSGYTDAEKTWLCTGSSAIAVGQSKANYSSSTALTTDNWTRITLTGQNGTAGYVYTAPRKLLVNMSTALGVNCLVEYKTGVSDATWQTFGTYAVSGWSGWNDIPLILGTFGGGSNQTSNNWYLRFTFKISSTRTDNYKGMAQVLGLRLFGSTDWTSASSAYSKGPFSSTGHLYAYDVNANATFPAQVTATQFNGNATSATKANLTTTANAIAYYTDTAGTFGSKASANGALYATSANGTLTFGTLPAAQGGTGKTNLKDAANALINALDTGSSNLTSNDYVITQYVGGGTTTTTYHRRPASALRVGGLLTGRKLKVALGSTTDVTFDGTSDVTNIPVSGTLGVSNGGTGTTSFTSGALLIGNGSSAVGTRSIVNNTTKGALGWTGSATTASNLYIPTLNTLAYWNGAYSGTDSNLTYCVKGAFGTATIKDSTTSVASGGTALPTAGAVYTAIRAASDTYVTLTTAQTLAAAATKTYLGLQLYGSQGIGFGTTGTNDAVTQKANVKYDATREAVVFSFS